MGLREYQKVSEMTMPSLSPLPQAGMLGSAPTPPVFYDANGNPITCCVCGDSFTYDVPGSGLSQIWLIILKNGVQTFNNLFSIPMAPYTTSCSNDVGQYQHLAYDPNTGILLGQTTFAILPAGQSCGPSPIAAAGGPSLLTTLENLSTPAKVALAIGAYLLLK
jgi:hypothetical protein